MTDQPSPQSVLKLTAKHAENPAIMAAKSLLELSLTELSTPYQFGVDKALIAGRDAITKSPDMASCLVDPLYTYYVGSIGTRQGYSTLPNVTSDLFSDMFRRASLLHRVHVQTDMLVAMLQAVGEEIEW